MLSADSIGGSPLPDRGARPAGSQEGRLDTTMGRSVRIWYRRLAEVMNRVILEVRCGFLKPGQQPDVTSALWAPVRSQTERHWSQEVVWPGQE